MEQPLSLAGKHVLITGANTGIGFVTARELCRRGAAVTMACRDEARARAAADQIEATVGVRPDVLSLDLADLASVRACAGAFLARDLPLHVLINNAGLAGKRGLTSSGFEMAFGVHHVGHFLLTQLLLPRLTASAPARVVTVASKAHYRIATLDLEAVRRPTSLTGIREYQASKLANVLFSAELARRVAGTGVTSYSLHPGVIDTEIWRELPALVRPLIKLRKLVTVEEGALTTLHCATAPELAHESGLYYDTCKPKEPSKAAQDVDLARALWERSLAWTR